MGAQKTTSNDVGPQVGERVLYGLIALICLLVFALDLLAPSGVAAGVPYVAAVVLALYSGSRRVVLTTAVTCSLLTLVGFGFSPNLELTEFWSVIANRSLAMMAIWVTAAISAHLPGELQKHKNNPHRPTTLLAFAALFSLLVLISMNWLFFRTQTMDRKAELEDINIARMAGRIKHLDEVLTMSARMAAATGSLAWEHRYRKYEKKLDQVLQEAKAIMPVILEGNATEKTAAANEKLVAIENRAFDSVRNADPQAAAQLLISPEYERQKAIYDQGVKQYREFLVQRTDSRLQTQQYQMRLHAALSALAIGAFVCIWMACVRMFARWRQYEESYHKDLCQHAEYLKQEAKRREQAQNELVVAIESLEKQKKELEQFNALAVGRELRMIELKHEVNELAAANGGEERYDTDLSHELKTDSL